MSEAGKYKVNLKHLVPKSKEVSEWDHLKGLRGQFEDTHWSNSGKYEQQKE